MAEKSGAEKKTHLRNGTDEENLDQNQTKNMESIGTF